MGLCKSLKIKFKIFEKIKYYWLHKYRICKFSSKHENKKNQYPKSEALKTEFIKAIIVIYRIVV